MITRFVIAQDYSNRKIKAWARTIPLSNNQFKLTCSTRQGKRIVEFYNSIITNLVERGLDKYIPDSVKSVILKTANPDYELHNRCEIRVFKKNAIPKEFFKMKYRKTPLPTKKGRG